MVKRLDENDRMPPLIDHVGWRLWRLARLWKTAFEREMAVRRLEWCAGARAELIGALRQGPQPQSALADELGITKQAVQQIVDDLAAIGAVERRNDPDDARTRLVALTLKGRRTLEESNAVKQEIEARLTKILGRRRFDALMDDLEKLTVALESKESADRGG